MDEQREGLAEAGAKAQAEVSEAAPSAQAEVSEAAPSAKDDAASIASELASPAASEASSDSANDDDKDAEDDDDFFEPAQEYEDIEAFYKRISRKLKWQDKVAFTLGVWNLVLTAYLFGEHNVMFLWLYTVKYVILMTLRFVTYHRQKWHYFMLDFCYYANTALLVYCWAFPHQTLYFKIIYAVTHGPLLGAVALFRNSLVFHSADKLTSAFIHISPPLLTHLIRWYPQHFPGFVPCGDAECSATFWELCLLPAATFVGHEFYYFFVTGFVKRKKLRSDPTYITSFRYLSQMAWLQRLIGIFGPRLRVPMFVFFNGLYGLLTVSPAYFYWHYYWVELTVLIIMLTLSMWNGAGFYVEIFARRQNEKYTKFGALELEKRAAASKKQS